MNEPERCLGSTYSEPVWKLACEVPLFCYIFTTAWDCFDGLLAKLSCPDFILRCFLLAVAEVDERTCMTLVFKRLRTSS